MVEGNGAREVAAEAAVTKPVFLQEPKILFGGFTGLMTWAGSDRFSNARIALNNIRIDGDKIKWTYNTWADS